MINTNRFIEIINDFKIIQNRTGLDITPDALFTNARALFISEQIAQQRGQNKPIITEQPATTKQLNYLRALNIDVPENLTKKEAFLLIKESVGYNGT